MESTPTGNIANYRDSCAAQNRKAPQQVIKIAQNITAAHL